MTASPMQQVLYKGGDEPGAANDTNEKQAMAEKRDA